MRNERNNYGKGTHDNLAIMKAKEDCRMNGFERSSGRYWVVPSLYIFAALGIAVLMDTLDHTATLRLEEVIPRVLLTKTRIAESVLSAIATSLLSMTTITFSVMMVVLSTNASQYTPRTLPTFIQSKTMQHAQGMFFAGFTYSIAALHFLKRSEGDRLVFDASVAVLFALICLLFFVYFIHQVSKFIRVNTLIQIVSEKAVTLIHAFKTVGTLGESELTSSTRLNV